MIDLEIDKEIMGRFSIEEVLSENEEEFVKNIPVKKREFDILDNIQNIKKSKPPHLSTKKEFVYIENNNPLITGYKCEIFNKISRNYEDFSKIWNSFKSSYHVDESNLLDLHFNIQKENEFIKINDFYETHSDFKDNIINHIEIIDKTLRQDVSQKNKKANERTNEKIKESHIIDKGTALNSTLENSCLNIKKFCSIGTQTDTIEQETKQASTIISLTQNNINLSILKKGKKPILKKNKQKEKHVEDLDQKNNSTQIKHLKGKIDQSINDLHNPFSIANPKTKKSNLNSQNKTIKNEFFHEREFNLDHLNIKTIPNYEIKRTESEEYCIQMKEQRVINFTVFNVYPLSQCEKCLRKESFQIEG